MLDKEKEQIFDFNKTHNSIMRLRIPNTSNENYVYDLKTFLLKHIE
ncbi:MAG: hypothetical protein ACRCXT_16730 [Paraclostridium sp.]